MRPFRRAGRRTNLGLLALLTAALATGVAAFSVGTPGPAWVVTLLHGAAGLGLLVLAPWKSVVVRRSTGRGRPPVASVALGVVVLVAVAAGVLHAVTGADMAPALTAMQVHVGAGLVLVPLVGWHVVRHRQRFRRTDLSRRAALRAAGVVGGALALWAGAEGLGALLGAPGARRRSTGSYEIGSGSPDAMPVTQWFTDPVPTPDPAAPLRLTVLGTPREVSRDVLDGDDRMRAVLDCTGGWYAAQDWQGVRLDRLPGVADARGARCVEVVSATGYRRRFPVAEAGRLLLATRVGGASLTSGHGAPLRLVAPGRRGFWWVKWVTAVHVLDEPPWWQPPFPPQ